MTARLTYAENFEDLLLDRVFRNRHTGVYVDVGAADPVRNSVTLKVHLRGWRGVNVEPSPVLHAALVRGRSGDVNLNVAAGATPSDATFYQCDAPELSTLDAAVAAALRAAGRTVEELRVPVRTLAQICREHCGDKQIDFLKIDAAGWEAQVLAGGDFAHVRPRILVIAALRPLTDEPAHQEWEPKLIAEGYSFAWFDGLNRFYVRDEEPALLEHFRAPVGVADGFSPYDMFAGDYAQSTALDEAALLRDRIGALEAETRRLRFEAEDWKTLTSLQRRGWLRRKFGSHLGILRHYPARNVTIPQHYHVTRQTSRSLSVAIVTPCLNERTYLADAMDSVLGQNYVGLHYVIQDGRSSDGSLEPAQQCAAAYPVAKVEVISQSDDGHADAINRGFSRTATDLMAWLNADSLLLPGAIAYVADFFACNPDVDLVYGHRIVVDPAGREVARWILPPHMANAMGCADFVPQETLFWRRRVWERIGPLDTSLSVAFDRDFILRAQRAGFRFKRLPRFLGAFRVHELQEARAMSPNWSSEMAQIRRRHFGRDVTAQEIDKGLRLYHAMHVLLHRAYKLNLVRY